MQYVFLISDIPFTINNEILIEFYYYLVSDGYAIFEMYVANGRVKLIPSIISLKLKSVEKNIV